MLFGRKKRVQISGNSWGVYRTQTGDNLPLIVRVDTDLAQEERHRGYDHSARLRLHAEHPLDNGLPARDELPALAQLEDRLVQLLESKGVRCRLAASLTGGGTRELLFQVQDVAGLRDCVSGLLAGGERRWELLEDEGWKYFDEAARPPADGWRQIEDQVVVSQLLKAGSNPEADLVTPQRRYCYSGAT